MKNARTIVVLLASSFLQVLMQFLGGLEGRAIGLICGGLVGIVLFGLAAFFQIELPGMWVEILLPIGASVLGIALVFLGQPGASPQLWLAPLLAGLVSATVVGVRRARSKRCGLCNRRLGSTVAFACPRCGLLVCDQTCWVFEFSRCRLCEQNRVPVFPADGRWWDRQLGPRSQQGRCQLCMTPAGETDLRNCRKCGRPQCRECWDLANGQCNRCQWTVEDLPEALRVYVIHPPAAVAGQRSSRHAK
jgi:hypothetical protein